jgi:hypothetical protein
MVLKRAGDMLEKKQRGSQYEYSAQAITIMLTVKSVFHLPNRGTEGFVGSIFAMLGVELLVPDHTTLSRRGKEWQVQTTHMEQAAYRSRSAKR